MKYKIDLVKNPFSLLDEENQTQHISTLKALIKKVLPNYFLEDEIEMEDLKKAELFLNENLPILKWIEIKDTTFSVILFSKHRKNATSFFYDMISRYLIPQKKINLDLFYSADFGFSNLLEDKFSVMQAVISVDDIEDIKAIEKNKKTFETEIRLGIVSDFHANRISEFKGLSNDRKTAMVQEKIGSLMQKRPKEFGKNIFSEMQQFLIMSRDEFKSQRDYHHISRIISILYMIRKLLKQNIEQNPEKRYVILKFLKTRLKSQENQESEVLGILVGLNFLKENEVFEKKHLTTAIKNFLPYVDFVENSFFIDKASKNDIQTCYMEAKKPNSINFTDEEIQVLKDELPTYLKGNVEQLIHPVFMPRNEEEIVKNMLVLSSQLKYVHDIPQVIISFDKQTYTDLSFNVILLRVLRPMDLPIKDLITKTNRPFKFIIDKVKKVGVIRRKYLKEANVFRVFLQSANYLRSDHSVDINKARLDVLEELNQLFGEVRDYMGGMIYKQNEAYKSLQNILGQIGKHYDNLLEKFFYSIAPSEMTAIVKPDIMKNLFLMLINAIKREETRIKKHSDFLFKQEMRHLYIIIPVYDPNIKKKIKDQIDNINILSSELISFSLTSHDVPYLGYVYINDDKAMQKVFFSSIQKSLA